jgi:hypothetical protein
MRRAIMASVIAGLVSTASFASAASIIIDFETQSTGSAASLSASDPALSSPVVFTTTDTSNITVSDLSSISGAITFGSRSISASAPIFITFPTAVSSVSVQAGHNDGNSYSLTLQAFANAAGTGSALGSDTEPLPAVGTLFNSTNLEVDQAGIMSAEISGGGSGVFFDNVGLTTGPTGGGTAAVPLPSSLMMFPLGAACAGLVLYRNRGRMRTSGNMWE